MSLSTSSYIPVSSSENDRETLQLHAVQSPKKGIKFWLVLASTCVCLSLSALELSSVSTALPTIANALQASRFTWIGSAYALASTAFLPMSGGLAQVFGRRPVLVLSIALFALGSGLCGSANDVRSFVVGRIIQGLGGGGIQSVTAIILADLITLQERGAYSGLCGLIWCLSASFGPILGGSFASRGQWRWLFYLNLPISCVACLLVIFLMDLPTPSGNYREKFMRMDWIGSFLVIASTAAYTVGLMWSGITTPWGLPTILVPLVFGLVGLSVFITYEATLAKQPLVPFSLMTNRTSLSGYMQTFYSFVTIFGVTYYIPVYFQACKGVTPLASGLYSLAFASFAPAIIITGISVKFTGRYRIQAWIGWIITILTFGFMSTILATDPLEKSMWSLVVLGWGAGMLSATPAFPIQASQPVTQNAPVLAFMWSLRSFASVWGITIGSTILQNQLAKKLPPASLQCVPEGPAIMYSLIPDIPMLPPHMLSEVRVAFAGSLAVLWRTLAIISCAGLIVSLFMGELPLHDTLDADWTLKHEKVDDLT